MYHQELVLKNGWAGGLTQSPFGAEGAAGLRVVVSFFADKSLAAVLSTAVLGAALLFRAGCGADLGSSAAALLCPVIVAQVRPQPRRSDAWDGAGWDSGGSSPSPWCWALI